MGLTLYGLAGLGLILALSLMAFEIEQALGVGDLGTKAMTAFSHSPDSSVGSPADASVVTGDGEDEEAFPSLLAAATLTGLISYLTFPPLTGLSFYHPPLLQPPQPR